jgi:hypothetical protein
MVKYLNIFTLNNILQILLTQNKIKAENLWVSAAMEGGTFSQNFRFSFRLMFRIPHRLPARSAERRKSIYLLTTDRTLCLIHKSIGHYQEKVTDTL